jgi:DHA1 family inner membrane transport protein
LPDFCHHIRHTVKNMHTRAATTTPNSTQQLTHQIDSSIVPGRFWTLPVILLTAMSFALGANEFIMMGILPDVARGLHISQVLVGDLVSAFAAVYAVCTPLVSALSARFQRYRVYLGMATIFLIGNGLSGFVSSYATLAISRIIVALVAGPMVAVAMTFAPQVTEPKNRTRFMAWVFSGFSIASVVGVPLGTWVAGRFGWRWAFHLISILIIALLILCALFLPRRSHVSRIGFFSQFLLFTDPRIILSVACVIFGAAATYVFYTYITPIMETYGSVPAEWISAALIVYGCAALASNLFSGKLARNGTVEQPLGRVWPIYLTQAACLILLAVGSYEHLPILVLAAILCLGFLMYLQNSPSQICYTDSAAQYHPGSLNLANSLNSMSFNIGIAIGAAVGGLVRDHLSLASLGLFGALFALMAAGCAGWLLAVGKRMRDRRERRDERE